MPKPANSVWKNGRRMLKGQHLGEARIGRSGRSEDSGSKPASDPLHEHDMHDNTE